MDSTNGVKSAVTVVVAVAAMLWLSPLAYADSIRITTSSLISSFKGNSNGTLTQDMSIVTSAGGQYITTSASTLEEQTGPADNFGQGTLQITPTSTFTTGAENAQGQFFYNQPATSTLTWSDGDGESFTGTVVWSFIQDGSANPTQSGVATITTASGGSENDSGFLAVWGVGTKVDLNLTFSGVTPSPLDLAALSETANSTLAIAEGNVSPTAATPEPSSLLLFGVGLLAMGVVTRRKLLGVE